jgi:hypothetical protein
MDVLHLRYPEQAACFMVLLKWPIDGLSSILIKSENPLENRRCNTSHILDYGDRHGQVREPCLPIGAIFIG